MQLWPEQQIAVEHATAFFSAASPGDKRFFTSPTGTGKSVIELSLLRSHPQSWLLTPWNEVVAGLVSKLGYTLPASLDALSELAWGERISTPIRLRNAMLHGAGPAIGQLIVDEAHHADAETYRLLELLSGLAPAAGFSATGFRGTPKGTADLRERWGVPIPILTYPEAAALGRITIPSCRTIPLVDDDQITITGGEFAVRQVEAAVGEKAGYVAELLRPCFVGGQWDRPTILACPTQASARVLAAAVGKIGWCVSINSETPYNARQAAFRACVGGKLAIAQVRVIGEGVDLPLRRLVDVAPHMSPVLWLQQFGRVTRPGGESEYWCCNRNLARHAYLLDGCLPPSVVSESDDAFDGPSTRASARAFGLESLGRLRPTRIKTVQGESCLAYAITQTVNTAVTEYYVIVRSNHSEPIWARRDRLSGSYGTRWQRCDPPQDLTGFASLKPNTLTPKQAAWWSRAATSRGLEVGQKITSKEFQVLPVLCDLGVRL